MAHFEKLREMLRGFLNADDEMIASLKTDNSALRERILFDQEDLEKLRKEYDEEVISHDIAESDLKEKLLKYETLCHRNEDCPVGGLVQMVRRLRNELDNYRQGKSMYGIMDTIVEADKLLEKYQI